MALFKINGNIEYSQRGYIQSPPVSGTSVKRHYYECKAPVYGIANTISGKYIMPHWIKVHYKTELKDIIVEEPKKELFEELFVEPKNWKFKSATSDKEYTVREGKNGLHCDCWGYIAHRKCKHLKEVSEKEF